MKNFEELDVFVPGEESKERMKFVYNMFVKAIDDLGRKFEEDYQKGDFEQNTVVYLYKYVPEEWKCIFMHYYLTITYFEEFNHIGVSLIWEKITEGDSESSPLVVLNMSGEYAHSYDNGNASYILMVALISHLGLELIKTSELIQEMNKES